MTMKDLSWSTMDSEDNYDVDSNQNDGSDDEQMVTDNVNTMMKDDDDDAADDDEMVEDVDMIDVILTEETITSSSDKGEDGDDADTVSVQVQKLKEVEKDKKESTVLGTKRLELDEKSDENGEEKDDDDDDDDKMSASSGSVQSSEDEYSFCSGDGDDDEEKSDLVDGYVDIAKAFNMEMLHSCIEKGSNVLDQVDGQDVVLVIGKTGVGKSLFIQGIAGKKIVSTVHEEMEAKSGEKVSSQVFEAEDALPEFEVGHEKVSKTRSINVFVRRGVVGKSNKKKDLFYIDSPGFEDTGGPEVDIATSIMLSQVSARSRSLRFVVLINYASLLEDRGGAMRAVLKLAHTFVADFDRDKKSFMFLFTHTHQMIDMPNSSLETARSFLEKDILRIKMGTDDPGVSAVLKFMHHSISRKYPFVDVLHPLLSNFRNISTLIETKLSTIRNPALIMNCGLTPQSKMKLVGQLNRMLYDLRGLVHENASSPKDQAIRIKHIRDYFRYFKQFVAIDEVNANFNDCERLLERYLNNQRLLVEEELQKATNSKKNFGVGNIRVLKAAVDQLNALSDGVNNYGYFEKRIQAVAQEAHNIVMDLKVDNITGILVELGKLKALSDSFVGFSSQYEEARRSVVRKIQDTAKGAAEFGGAPEKNIEEHFVDLAGHLVQLHIVFEMIRELEMHEIDLATHSCVFSDSRAHLFSLSKSFGVKTVVYYQDKGTSWNDALNSLFLAVQRAKKLEYATSMFEKVPACTEISDTIKNDLITLEAASLESFEGLCGLFVVDLKQFPPNAENKMNSLSSIAIAFSELNGTRSKALQRPYRDVVWSMSNQLHDMATQIEYSARLCGTDGMRDGGKEAERFLALFSYAWYDKLPNCSSFVVENYDSILMIYHGRLEDILHKSAGLFRSLQVGSDSNIRTLEICHECAMEIKQLNQFFSVIGQRDVVVEKRKVALVETRRYREDLVEKTRRWSAKWYEGLRNKNFDEARALTEGLDRVLAEIETIETFKCLPKMKEAAAEAKTCILRQFHTAKEYAEGVFKKSQEYQAKADCLACLARINGFTRTDLYLPNFCAYKEKARTLVSEDSQKIQSLVEESADENQIDEALETFEKASVLDPYTSNEASKLLRPLQYLHEKKIEDRNKHLESMIEGQDYKGIGIFLRPLRNSNDLIKKQQFEQHMRTISSALKRRTGEAQERLAVSMYREDVEVVADSLCIMTDAQQEIGSLLACSGYKLSSEVNQLKHKLCKRLDSIVDAFLAGYRSGDFYAMGKNHHFALLIFKYAEPYLDCAVKGAFRKANLKMDEAISDLSKHADKFLSSLFQESRPLVCRLSSLKMAASSEDPELPKLKMLYEKTVEDLSQRTNTLLQFLHEEVTEAGSYEDGIQALEALGKSIDLGLTEHTAPLPFHLESVLDGWKDKQAQLLDLEVTGGNDSEVFKEYKLRLDQLKNAGFLGRLFKGTPITYKRLQQRLEDKSQKQLDQGLSSLRERDWTAVRKCLDTINIMKKELNCHISSLQRRQKELQDKVVTTFIEICKESVKILESADCRDASSFVSFEAIFPELHDCVIHFTGVLTYDRAAKVFCLVNQLIHDLMENGITQLKEAIASLSFSQARALIIHNRTHGAFLADNYALFYEELKQQNKYQDDKWLSQIWKLCCESFWRGRDLKNIKACAILGVLPSASENDIRKAYKLRARQTHPDKKTGINNTDVGEDFRRVKDAHDLLLETRSKEEPTSQLLFDDLINAIPGALNRDVRDHLREQKYELVEQLLERFSDFKTICNLVSPPLDYDVVRSSVVIIVRDRVHEAKVDVDTYWNERKYKELNFSIGDLKQMEQHFKSFPDVFPESWNKGIVEKVEQEIESLGQKARSFLKDKKTAMEHEDDFRRCFIQMGAVMVELQPFKDYTKSVMYGVLETCLNSDWGYSYLFELGLSFHRGDDRVAQTLLSEFTHFKEVMTMVWNEETVQKPVEDTVADIRGVQRRSNGAPPSNINIDRDALLASFYAFDSAYKLLLGEYLPADADKRKLANKTITLANDLKPLRCGSGWDSRVKSAIPQILAGVFCLFTVLKSGESFNRIQEGSADAQKIGQKLLMKPHNIQVLVLLHLLGCGAPNTTCLENQLMQIRTGEGKSMILGATAAILGLLGFKVHCVCYSEYLSTRDYSLFEQVFTHFGLKGLVTYSKITTLSEDTTARKGDIRALTESLIRQKPLQKHPRTGSMVAGRSNESPGRNLSSSSLSLVDDGSTNESDLGSDKTSTIQETSPQTTDLQQFSEQKSPAESLEEILLVDEVDVFFGPDFYGQTYNKVMELREPEIATILIDIWTKHNQGGQRQRLADVQASSTYQSLVQKIPSFQYLIDNEIRLMLDHVRRVDEERYYLDAENDRIGYKVLDTISYKVTYGYRTIFAYLKEANDGNLLDKTSALDRVLSMPIQCGQFSYANISPSRILGVSGTLEAMGQYEKDVLQSYGIEKFIFVPSVYGQSNFVFDKAGDGIFIEPNKSDYFQKICDEIISKIQQRRAVIVFFENIARLCEFKSSPFYAKLGRNKAVLSENMDPSVKEFVINKAATSGQITLSPAVFGRGTDFFCKDDRVQDGGGVHIIQTFLSHEKSEEVQIQGRTSRQGKKGSYQLLLWEDDLCRDFDLKLGEKDSVPRNRRYDWLCDTRDKQNSQHWKKVEENLAVATRRDSDTHQYFDALIAGSRDCAIKLFKDLYTIINKPPIPDAITVDVAVLIDVTGSMAPYCQPTVSTIKCLISGNNSILTKLKTQFPDTAINLHLGILGYRDIDDKNAQFCEGVWNGGAHFTDSVTDALAHINSTVRNPSGGHDIAEDHLGALNRCLAWNGPNDWSSPIKLILLFTDAPAHGFVPSSSSSLPNVDGYSVRHPNGLTPASVAHDLVTKGINLITCSYNPFATTPFEKQIASDYSNHPSNAEGREIKSISMIPQSAVQSSTGQGLIGDHPRHIVFVLDESGSMNGHWRGVVDAFQKYITQRQQNQNESDLVSVVQFDNTARVTVYIEPIGSASRNLSSRGGGTKFTPAALEGSQLAASTPVSHKPTVVFMSDGGSSDAPAAASAFAALNKQVNQKHGCDLDLHVIAFGGGADTQQLNQISQASPKGRVYLSSDTVQLTNIFTNIAGGQQVATVLQEEIGKDISEAVSDTLCLGYLS